MSGKELKLRKDGEVDMRQFNPGSKVKKSKRRSLEREIRDKKIARLFQYMSAKEIGKMFNIDERRVYQIIKEQERRGIDELKGESKEVFAQEGRQRLESLIDTSLKMIRDSEEIEDTETKLKIRGMAIEKARQSIDSLHELYKYMGIFAEHTVNANINVTESKEWERLKMAIMTFLKYELGVDPALFFNFMDKVESDPTYLDRLVKQGPKEVKEAEEESVLDVEFEEVSMHGVEESYGKREEDLMDEIHGG